MKRLNEGRKKLKREKSDSRKSSRAAFRKLGEPSPPLRTRGVFWTWRKLFQKDRKCAREWTTAPKLNITSQSFVECAAIYSVSLADPVYINRSYFALMIEPTLSRNILRKVTRLVVFFSSSTLLPCIPTRKRDDFQGGKFDFQSL